ncbi:AAA family ATPase [Lactobacillus sp. CC-MHH1034]|uniref:RNA polymerase recycling motor HelD n=1 Tax=Agrilactobacillus fermenti TaxID=2586909 RepID=UPI001E5F379D|nr:RNA polymerase recycling motor HelD [Agrilactobacillus fermenti]MCD2256800.1 AAA family ATPase [Agrilactobacillus fermenti]
MEKSERTQEQNRVNHVRTQIKKQLAETKAQLDLAHKETHKIELNYGDNTKVNVTEVDDQMETNAAVQQQKDLVASAVETEKILQNQAALYEALSDSPYFGRIDIDEDGEKDTLYIGTATLQDEDDNFLIYDWRAPISSIYYNGTLGPVTYDTPVGRQQVDLEKKRQFLIEHGQIQNMFDTNETVGDEILQSVLGQQNDEHMRNIVATIQKEQNDIIRNTNADLLVVQGVAGSGKTSAILQRIAYLLYHSRSQLNADQIILFSPNRLFSNYISEVLPSLGEKNMRQVTLAEFLDQRFSGLAVETLFDRFEKDQQSLPELAQEIRRYKESPDFMVAIKTYVKQTDERSLAFSSVYYNGKPFFTKAEIQAIYLDLPKLMLPRDKFLQTKNTLIKRLKRHIRTDAKADDVQEAVSLLDDYQYQDLVAGKHFRSGDEEINYVARALVRKRYEVIYDALYNDYFMDLYAEYGHFLATARPENIAPTVWQTMVTQVQNDIEAHKIHLEDAAPILYLRDLLTGSGQNHSMQYLFVDEMQDYAPAQLIYLKHAFPRAKLTLLGDSAQDVFTADYNPSDFIHTIETIFPHDRLALFTLLKSYRSTKPITDFAKAMLPDGDQIQAFSRDGHKPNYYLCPDQATATQKVIQLASKLLVDQPTVAILTKTEQAANHLFATLKTDHDVTLMTDRDRSIPHGILIIPIYLAKGLEFDAVIGYDISAKTYGHSGDRDILYTLASRAMHNLELIGIDVPSPIIKTLDANLFHWHDIDPVTAKA